MKRPLPHQEQGRMKKREVLDTEDHTDNRTYKHHLGQCLTTHIYGCFTIFSFILQIMKARLTTGQTLGFKEKKGGSAHTPRNMAMLESFFFDRAVSSVAGPDCMITSGTSVVVNVNKEVEKNLLKVFDNQTSPPLPPVQCLQ